VMINTAGPPRSCADEITGVCPCGFDGDKNIINCKYENMTSEEAASHLYDSCRISRDIARLLWGDKMIINTKFDIGQKVTIIEPGYRGRIVEIRQDGLNLWYKTQYWEDGKCNFIDLCEDELAPNKPDNKCGI